MGGAWRDRGYRIPPPPPPFSSGLTPPRAAPPPADRLTTYAALVVIGMILGATALMLAAPWLPVVLR